MLVKDQAAASQVHRHPHQGWGNGPKVDRRACVSRIRERLLWYTRVFIKNQVAVLKSQACASRLGGGSWGAYIGTYGYPSHRYYTGIPMKDQVVAPQVLYISTCINIRLHRPSSRQKHVHQGSGKCLLGTQACTQGSVTVPQVHMHALQSQVSTNQWHKQIARQGSEGGFPGAHSKYTRMNDSNQVADPSVTTHVPGIS